MKKEIAIAVAGALLGAGGMSAAPATISDVKSAQDAYFAQKGEYFECHTYDGPKGKGYQVFYKTDDRIISEGKGPESADRSFSQVIRQATSTP